METIPRPTEYRLYDTVEYGGLAFSTHSGLCRWLGLESSPVLSWPLFSFVSSPHRVDTTSADPDDKDESGEVLWGKQKNFLF